MRRERELLTDLVAAADLIAQFIQNQTAETFERDALVRSAVTHQLTVIGEAASRLTAELRSRYPDVPWSEIRGLRNIVVHNYFGIDWAQVWETAFQDIPVLRNQVGQILLTDFPE